MSKKYYLSHSTEIRNKVRFWELNVEDKYNIELVNPFYDVLGHVFEKIDRGIINIDEYRCKRPKGEIVSNDLKVIDKCDGIIAYIEEPSFGTSMELFYCRTALQRPIYIYCKNPKYKDHPWLTYCTDFIYTDLDQFYKVIETISKESK